MNVYKRRAYSEQDSEWPDRSVSRYGCLFEMTWDEVPDIGGTYIEDG